MENEKTEIEKLNLNSIDPTKERCELLLSIFPEIFSEGKIDVERLKSVFGEAVEEGRIRFGLNWPGKIDCFHTIKTPSVGTLRPFKSESVEFDDSENLIIEGDNLEALKLLQKSYLNKIKLIYIDPPYNTGNDFIYPDNYTESLHTYLEYTGQIDSEGRRFGTNSDTDGRFHSKWLNMMYPRLYLARNLLRDDGFIFISISDHEVASLRLLLNEIFGEENFYAQLVWKSRKFPDSRAKSGVSTDHEYILLYSKSSVATLKGIERDESKFSNPDNDPRGPWMSRSMLGLATREQRPNLHYPITDPTTGNVFEPPSNTGWRYSSERMKLLIDGGCVLFPSNTSGRPREKKFRSDIQSDFVAFPTIIDDIHTADGTAEIREIFGDDIFDFPKPSGLLEKLIEQGADDNEIVLDFFAGSGSFAHATLNLNFTKNKNLNFILVQLPEKIEKPGFGTIADITRERVRRVIKTLNDKEANELQTNGSGGSKRGFKSFKLAESNFKSWNQDTSKEALEEQLELHVDHVKHERTADDILYEILLKSGFPLTTKVETQKFDKQTVYSIAGGMLLVCLEDNLTLDLIKHIAEQKPERVVCLDQGFANNDQLKANAVQIFRTKSIAKFQTV